MAKVFVKASDREQIQREIMEHGRHPSGLNAQSQGKVACNALGNAYVGLRRRGAKGRDERLSNL